MVTGQTLDGGTSQIVEQRPVQLNLDSPCSANLAESKSGF